MCCSNALHFPRAKTSLMEETRTSYQTIATKIIFEVIKKSYMADCIMNCVTTGFFGYGRRRLKEHFEIVLREVQSRKPLFNTGRI